MGFTDYITVNFIGVFENPNIFSLKSSVCFKLNKFSSQLGFKISSSISQHLHYLVVPLMHINVAWAIHITSASKCLILVKWNFENICFLMCSLPTQRFCLCFALVDTGLTLAGDKSV